MFLDITESKTVEFKQDLNDKICKEIVAFLNSEGGTLYVGISDDGFILGLEDATTDEQRIIGFVRDLICPDAVLFTHVDIQELGGKEILVILVLEGTRKPYYLRKKGMTPNGVYMRLGTSSIPTEESTIKDLIKQTDGFSFEGAVSVNQDLSFESLTSSFIVRGIDFDSTKYLLLGMQTISQEFTNTGYLLSEQNQRTIKLAKFCGCRVSHFTDKIEFTGSLVTQLEDCYKRLNDFNYTSAQIENLYRKECRDYPITAIREALVNATVHSDYSIGGSTLIHVFDDRIEIISLGGLLRGLSPSALSEGVSVLRNRCLADVFARLGLIEAYGTGIKRIFEAYSDSLTQPELRFHEGVFKVILPNRNYKKEKQKELNMF